MSKASAGSYKPELDALRAVAILIVMLHHYIPREIPFAGYGVMLFLALSGYFGTRSLLQMRDHVNAGGLTVRKSLKLFYGRRYWRILPVHILVLVTTFIANVPYARSEFGWNATFTSNWGMLIADDWFGRFSPLWSLAVLEQFYLLWPITVLLVPPRHFLKVVFGMIATAVVFRLVSLAFLAGPFVWTMVPLGALDQLGFGALLALARHDVVRMPLLRGIRTVGSLVCGPVVFGVVIGRIFGYEPPYLSIWISVVASLFFAWTIDRFLRGIGGPLGSFLRHPWLAAAGRASYPAFLIHSFTELLIPQISMIAWIFEHGLKFVILVPATFILAHLATCYIEEPLGRFRKSRYSMPTGKVPAAQPLSG